MKENILNFFKSRIYSYASIGSLNALNYN